MDFSKSKLSRLIIAIVFLFSINIATAFAPFCVPQFIIEEDIMRVNTGNEQTIFSVQFFQNNELINEQKGCQTNSCTFDLSNLGSGTYLVIVTLNNGSISETIIMQ